MTYSAALDVMIAAHSIAKEKGVDPAASKTYREAVSIVEKELSK